MTTFKYNDEFNDVYITINETKNDKETTYDFVNINYSHNGKTHTKYNLDIDIPNDKIDEFHEYVINTMKMSNSHKIKQFTEESLGIKCPENPRKMTYDEVKFIISMMISEMAELAQTVSDSPEDALKLVKDCIGKDFNYNYKKPTDDISIIAEQVDAIIDAEYYGKNLCAKIGVNADKMFNAVHKANMDKKFSDGKFHRREEDGKVIKPPEWKEADIKKVIQNQFNGNQW